MKASERLQEILNDQQIGESELANILRCSPTTLQHIRNKRNGFSAPKARQIATLYNYNYKWVKNGLGDKWKMNIKSADIKLDKSDECLSHIKIIEKEITHLKDLMSSLKN